MRHSPTSLRNAWLTSSQPLWHVFPCRVSGLTQEGNASTSPYSTPAVPSRTSSPTSFYSSFLFRTCCSFTCPWSARSVWSSSSWLVACEYTIVRRFPKLSRLTPNSGIVGACFRLAFFVKTENLFTDPTWYSTSLLCWSCAEPGMYLIAACLLTLGPLFKAMPSLRKTVSSRYRKYKGSNESGESDSSTQPGFGATLESEKGMNVQSKSRGVTDDLDDLDLDLEEGDEKDAEQTRKSPSDATSGDLV